MIDYTTKSDKWLKYQLDCYELHREEPPKELLDEWYSRYPQVASDRAPSTYGAEYLPSYSCSSII